MRRVVSVFRGRGERMSGGVVDFLNACAETPGLPPCIAFEKAPADTTQDPVPAALVAPTHLSEIDTRSEVAPEERPLPTLALSAISENTQGAGVNPDLWLYRDRTVALLRRYMRLSIEVGRMPSLLGREFF